jgi:hypothetical protein
MKQIDDLFQKQIRAARMPDEKLQLSKLFFENALATDANVAAQFVMLEASANLAVDAGDWRGAWQSLDELGQRFVVDVLPRKASALSTVAKAAKRESMAVAQDWLALVEEAMARDDYDLALHFVGEAQLASQSTTDTVFQKRLTDGLEWLKQMQSEFKATRPASKRLAVVPTDADAAHSLGRFLCLYKNDWKQGLPLWATEPAIGSAATAKVDLDNPKTPGEQVKLADAWMSMLNQEHDGLPRTFLRARAAGWYRRAQPQSDPLTTAMIARRLEEISAAGSPFRIGEWVDVLAMVDPSVHFASSTIGFWTRQKTDVRLPIVGTASIAVPITTADSYELEIQFTPSFNIANGSVSSVGVRFPAGRETGFMLVSETPPPPEKQYAFKLFTGSRISLDETIPPIAANARHRLKLKVQIDPRPLGNLMSIDADLDGKPYFGKRHGDGPISILEKEKAEPGFDASRWGETKAIAAWKAAKATDNSPWAAAPFQLCVENGSAVFHAARFRLISGTADWLINPRDPTAATATESPLRKGRFRDRLGSY